MNLEALLHDYGYLAILIGTFLEGETILILGGVAAHFGVLDLALVMLSAFTGSSAGDQLYYFIGRLKGPALLDFFPRWKASAKKVSYHVERHQNLIILSFRFFYGLRNVTPFVLGISGVQVARFVPLNLIGAGIWAFSFAMLGYLLGEAHERILGKGYHLVILGALAVCFVGVWVFRKWRALRQQAVSLDVTPVPDDSGSDCSTRPKDKG